MLINNTFYPFYPKIREEDIGKDTSNKFSDTFNLSNLFLQGIGGDYDGDQITSKVAFTREANLELQKYHDSKAFYIDMGSKNVRQPEHEATQSLYSMTVKLKGYKKADVKIVKC